MNPEQMTDEQLRMRVAELLGAKWCQLSARDGQILSEVLSPYKHTRKMGDGWSVIDRPSEKWASHINDSIPNYPASLDACAEFEKILTKEQRVRFCKHLAWITAAKPESGWAMITATPRQRCIAFIRTMEEQ